MWLFALLVGAAVGQGYATDLIASNNDDNCPPPYTQMGNQCIFMDMSISGSWEDMQYVCEQLHGNLVGFQDANDLADIVDHILIKGRNYWTGANDIDEEGVWVWVSDNSSVHMGTPLWGNKESNYQDPQGGKDENCAALDKDDYYYLHDFPCNSTFSVICKRNDSQQPDLTNDQQKITETIPPSCPHPFEAVGGKCLFVNIIGTGNWSSQKGFCEQLGGSMAKVDDANILGAIFDFLSATGMNYQHLFMGASDLQLEGDWRWIDGSPVRMGTPFWGGFYETPQEPFGGTRQNCMVLYYSDFHFFHDFWCDDEIGVLCEY